MKKLTAVALLLTLSTLFTSCGTGVNTNTPTQENSSGAKAANIGKQFRMPINAEGNTTEQQNILDRQKTTSDPTKIMWMHLVDLNGRIYLRTPVRGKISSSSKRLEPATCAANGFSSGGYSANYSGVELPNGEHTGELIQIDGTYGSSDPYVYWFDPRGFYYQVGQGYILSDMPINTKEPVNEITGLYNIDKAAQEWQKSQNTKK